MRVSLIVNGAEFAATWMDPKLPLLLQIPKATLLCGLEYGRTHEVTCTFSTLFDDGDVATELECFGIQAAFPGSVSLARHYLGPVGKVSESSLFVTASGISEEGATVTLKRQYFTERCMSAPTVAEVRLADHIHTIIANDECLGSMCVTAVQNRVIKFPFYDLAMQQHGTTCPFTKFIKRFDVILGYWKVFRYPTDDRRQFPTFSFDLDGVRMTTVELFESREYLENDLARERIHHRAQIEIRCEVERLRSAGIPYESMVRQIGESRSFRTLREVQCTRLIRSYAALGDKGVVHHPRHSLMVVQGVPTDNRFAIF
jgi:hypothetical protein